ncbi:hypothetical protein DFJ74DRAFT_264114 [Hyaloraphidium curvatum]|nr:hypothetical protein DFJ74DRAFT_264114 [Hyaloraphidium curvatum]
MDDSAGPLPIELVEKIVSIGRLSPRDVYSLACTCSQFARTALPLLYRRVVLARPDAWRLVRTLGTDAHRTFDYPSWIAIVEAGGCCTSPLAIAFFDLLLSRLSRLESINLSGSVGFSSSKDGQDGQGGLKAKEVEGYLTRWLSSPALNKVDISNCPELFSASFPFSRFASICPALTTLVILDSRVLPGELAEVCASGAFPSLSTLKYNMDTHLATEVHSRSYLDAEDLRKLRRGCPSLSVLAPGMGFLDPLALATSCPGLRHIELDFWEFCPVSQVPGAPPTEDDADLAVALGLLSLSSLPMRTNISLHIHDLWRYRSSLKRVPTDIPSLGDALSRFFRSLGPANARLVALQYSPLIPVSFPAEESDRKVAEALRLLNGQSRDTVAVSKLILRDSKCDLEVLKGVFLEPVRETAELIEITTLWSVSPLEAVMPLEGVSGIEFAIEWHGTGRKSRSKADATLRAKGRTAITALFEALDAVGGTACCQ